jgi:hypothetical protein
MELVNERGSAETHTLFFSALHGHKAYCVGTKTVGGSPQRSAERGAYSARRDPPFVILRLTRRLTLPPAFYVRAEKALRPRGAEKSGVHPSLSFPAEPRRVAPCEGKGTQEPQQYR